MSVKPSAVAVNTRMNRLPGTILALPLTPLTALHADHNQPVARWTFDEPRGTGAGEQVGGRLTVLQGAPAFMPGARGQALKFDGFTTRLAHAARHLPGFGPALTVEAWIAPQDYSWAWTGIVDHDQNARAGFFLGINHLGHVLEPRPQS